MLDVGTSKMCCLIARRAATGSSSRGAAISSPKVCAPARSSMPRRPKPPSLRSCTRPSSRPGGRCARSCSDCPGVAWSGGQDRRSRPGRSRGRLGDIGACAGARQGAGARRGARDSACLAGGDHAGRRPALRDARGMVGHRLHIAVHLVRVRRRGPAQSPGGDRALPSRCRRGGRGALRGRPRLPERGRGDFRRRRTGPGGWRHRDRPVRRSAVCTSWRACRSARST